MLYEERMDTCMSVYLQILTLSSLLLLLLLFSVIKKIWGARNEIFPPNTNTCGNRATPFFPKPCHLTLFFFLKIFVPFNSPLHHHHHLHVQYHQSPSPSSTRSLPSQLVSSPWSHLLSLPLSLSSTHLLLLQLACCVAALLSIIVIFSSTDHQFIIIFSSWSPSSLLDSHHQPHHLLHHRFRPSSSYFCCCCTCFLWLLQSSKSELFLSSATAQASSRPAQKRLVTWMILPSQPFLVGVKLALISSWLRVLLLISDGDSVFVDYLENRLIPVLVVKD